MASVISTQRNEASPCLATDCLCKTNPFVPIKWLFSDKTNFVQHENALKIQQSIAERKAQFETNGLEEITGRKKHIFLTTSNKQTSKGHSSHEILCKGLCFQDCQMLVSTFWFVSGVNIDFGKIKILQMFVNSWK